MLSPTPSGIYPESGTPDFPFRLLGATHGIADARTPVIRRTDYESCTVEYVYEGQGRLDINGFSCAPDTDSVYILHRHSNHAYWPAKANPWKKIFFVADGTLMEELFRAYRLETVYHIPNCPQVREAFDEMMQIQHDFGGAAVHRQAALVFHRLLDEFYALLRAPREEQVPGDVLALKVFLDDHLERRVNLEDACRHLHRSCAHMIRRFKAAFGQTPYDYLMHRRIDTARLLLRHTALSVKEIAARLQFSDPYYFSNYFKRRTGLAPKHYKERA